MADVEIAQFDKFQQARPAGDNAIEAATSFIADFRSASLGRDVQETADIVAEEANQVRFAAESLQESGASADPLFDAARGRKDALVAQGEQVSANAHRVFDRYKRAIEQGATNKSAARVAVQKEMRDMIASNPVYADVIRQAAASAMGEEEFLVLTRDLAPDRTQTPAETELDKKLREARNFAEAKGARNGWTAQQIEQAAANAQAYVLDTYELGLKGDLLQGKETVNGLQVNFSVQGSAKVAQVDADNILQTAVSALRPGKGGMELDIQTVNNLTTHIDRQILQLSSSLRTYLAGSAQSVQQINEQIAQVLAPYNMVREFLTSQNAGARLAELQGALNASAHVTMFEMLPTYAAASQVFGENAQYALRALESNDSIANEVFVNSPMFRDLRESGVNLSVDQKRQLALHNMKNSVNSVLGKDYSVPLSADERMGASSYLGVMFNADSGDRNSDPNYQNVVNNLARRGDSLVGSELARTGDPDRAQLAAATLWKNNFDQAVASAEAIGRRWVRGREDTTDYVVEVQDSAAGTPVVVIRRFQLGGDVTATGISDRWREEVPIVQDAASESYRELFKPYKVDRQGTQRSALANPVIYEHLYGDSSVDVEGRLMDALDKANASRTGRYQQ